MPRWAPKGWPRGPGSGHQPCEVLWYRSPRRRSLGAQSAPCSKAACGPLSPLLKPGRTSPPPLGRLEVADLPLAFTGWCLRCEASGIEQTCFWPGAQMQLDLRIIRTVSRPHRRPESTPPPLAAEIWVLRAPGSRGRCSAEQRLRTVPSAEGPTLENKGTLASSSSVATSCGSQSGRIPESGDRCEVIPAVHPPTPEFSVGRISQKCHPKTTKMSRFYKKNFS